jgi:mannose-6-phosphate isomerase-like protein (cupin superfamily)
MYFRGVDMTAGFAASPHNPKSHEKLLSSDIDEAARSGSRTRLLRLDPGYRSSAAHAHDYWEELYLLEGEMTIEDGEDGQKRIKAPAYALRRPGVMHGPVVTATGCLLLDVNWYE